MIQRYCPECDGTGLISTGFCHTCKGKGTKEIVEHKKSVEVNPMLQLLASVNKFTTDEQFIQILQDYLSTSPLDSETPS